MPQKKKAIHKGKIEIFEDALENPKARFFGITNDFLAFTTVLSVLAIVLETVHSLSQYHTIFKTIEYAATALFTIEYLARLHHAQYKIRYVFSFFGIIDLLAIIPTYLGLGNFTFLKTARSLRIIRLLRIVRLSKLAKLKKKEGTSSLYTLNIQMNNPDASIGVSALELV